MPQRPGRVSGTFALVFATWLATSAAPPPPPDLTFPIPSPEQREAFRKSHVRLGGLQALRTPEQDAILAAQDDVDVQHYFLDVEFVPASQSVTGSVTVTGKSLVAGFQHLVLDLSANMSVTQVQRGATNLAYTRNGDVLDITLDQTFDPEATFSVKVTYNGVPLSTGFGSISWKKYPFNQPGTAVSTLSEPEGARSWWPCKDRPDDKATVEMWWTVPGAWTATGNGVLLATVSKSGNRKQYQWKATDPLTTYLVSAAATVYSKFSQSYTTLSGGTMPIDHYVYTQDLADAQVSFSALPSMIAFYAQTFGEYPFVEDKYGMTEFVWGGAMEHTTNTSYGFQLIDGGHGYDYVIAHELAHQWWGDAVSPRTWSDIWLNEGFATYAEALWAEHLNGASGYQSYMNSFWRSSFTGPVYNPVDLFGSTVYDKGGWVQHMLRHVVGDADFFAGMRDWYTINDNASADTAQYQALHEARYGGSLDWFFQQWVYGTGQPAYEYGFTSADVGGGLFRNYVRVRQTQTSAVQYTMPVDLTLVTGGGSEIRTVWNDALDQDFVLDTTGPLTDADLDQKDWILKSSVTRITLADADLDGVPDRNDNCAGVTNPVQTDFDADLAGDACDPDDDNDGLADLDDCAPFDLAQGSVGLADGLNVDTVAGQSRVTWNAAARAETHDVQRGSLAALGVGDYGACIATEVAGLAYDDADAPASGEGFAYLVRGHDGGCGGGGSLGTDSAGAPRPSVCP